MRHSLITWLLMGAAYLIFLVGCGNAPGGMNPSVSNDAAMSRDVNSNPDGPVVSPTDASVDSSVAPPEDHGNPVTPGSLFTYRSYLCTLVGFDRIGAVGGQTTIDCLNKKNGTVDAYLDAVNIRAVVTCGADNTCSSAEPGEDGLYHHLTPVTEMNSDGVMTAIGWEHRISREAGADPRTAHRVMSGVFLIFPMSMGRPAQR